jgi:hypothetical protein
MLVYQNFINGRNHNDSKLIRKDDKNVLFELISWLSNCATDKPLQRIRNWDRAEIYYPTRLCLRTTATNINMDLGDLLNDPFVFHWCRCKPLKQHRRESICIISCLTTSLRYMKPFVYENVPISRPTDATCDRFLFSIYMCITLHVSRVKRSSSGVPHRIYSLQFLCLCLSLALSCKTRQCQGQTQTQLLEYMKMHGPGNIKWKCPMSLCTASGTVLINKFLMKEWRNKHTSASPVSNNNDITYMKANKTGNVRIT